MPQLVDVATDQQNGGLAASLIIDRVTASRLGIAPSTIDNTLYDAFGQRQINTMYTQLNQYHVILEALPQFQQDPKMLQKMYIQANTSSGASGPGAASSFASSGSAAAGSNALTTPVQYTPSSGVLIPPNNAINTGVGANRGQYFEHHEQFQFGNAVPLSAFTHFERTQSPLSINHQGQFPAVTVSFNLAPNVALGTAITAVEGVAARPEMPPSLQADFQGTAAAFRTRSPTKGS